MSFNGANHGFKPCPYCGGNNVSVGGYAMSGEYYVDCANCSNSICFTVDDDVDDTELLNIAHERWNNQEGDYNDNNDW